MIKQDEVIAFFDKVSETWDEDIIKDPDKIKRILDAAQIRQGVKVLDVACGTGVLIPDYLERGVEKVTAFDISLGMIEVAKSKFQGIENVEFQCTDIEHLRLDESVDCIMIYNAFPHFANPEMMIRLLADRLVKGGTLTVAHDMGIEQLNAHHVRRAQSVSNGLISTREMIGLFEPYFDVTHAVSEEEIYYVSGVKNKK
jgi:demethylmenaquinone methyltransferase/2-methoxy-6-polyprenyl-1,4-benzoquinol methylase